MRRERRQEPEYLGSAGPSAKPEPVQPVPAAPSAAPPAEAISIADLLDYVASFSDDFAGMALHSQLPRLSLLLDMVACEAKRERDRH